MDQPKTYKLVASSNRDWEFKVPHAIFVAACLGVGIGLGLLGTRAGAPVSLASIFVAVMALYTKIHILKDRLDRHPVAKKFVVDVVHEMIEDAKAVVKNATAPREHEVPDMYEVDIVLRQGSLAPGDTIEMWNQERLQYPFVVITYGGLGNVISGGTSPANNF